MKLKRVFALGGGVDLLCNSPACTADEVVCHEESSVSGDYEWTRVDDDNITLNVYNWVLYISDGSE